MSEFKALKTLFNAEEWDVLDNGDQTYNVYCELGCDDDDLVASKVNVAGALMEYLLLTGSITDEQFEEII